MAGARTISLQSVRTGDTISVPGEFVGVMHVNGDVLCQPMTGAVADDKLPTQMPPCPKCGQGAVFHFTPKLPAAP